MEYIKHGTLYSYFKEVRKCILSIDEVKQIMRSLLSSIAYLHSQNIIHRDIKQENILIVDPNDLSQIKLADFGLSSQFETNKFATFNAQCGTLAYMSPEFFDNYNPCTKAVDVYSCGVLLYELTHKGHHPFLKSQANFQSLSSIKKCILEAKYNDFNCSYEIETLIKRMTAKEQSERLSAQQALGAFTRNEIPSTISEMIDGMEKQSKIQQIFHLILFILWLKNTLQSLEETSQCNQEFTYEPNLNGLEQQNLLQLRQKIKASSSSNKVSDLLQKEKGKALQTANRSLKFHSLKIKMNSLSKLEKPKIIEKNKDEEDNQWRSSIDSSDSKEQLTTPEKKKTQIKFVNQQTGRKSAFFNQRSIQSFDMVQEEKKINNNQEQMLQQDFIIVQQENKLKNLKYAQQQKTKQQIKKAFSQNASMLSSHSAAKQLEINPEFQQFPKEIEQILEKNLITKRAVNLNWGGQKQLNTQKQLQLQVVDTSSNQLYYNKSSKISTPSRFMPQSKLNNKIPIQQKTSENTRNRSSVSEIKNQQDDKQPLFPRIETPSLNKINNMKLKNSTMYYLPMQNEYFNAQNQMNNTQGNLNKLFLETKNNKQFKFF